MGVGREPHPELPPVFPRQQDAWNLAWVEAECQGHAPIPAQGALHCRPSCSPLGHTADPTQQFLYPPTHIRPGHSGWASLLGVQGQAAGHQAALGGQAQEFGATW